MVTQKGSFHRLGPLLIAMQGDGVKAVRRQVRRPSARGWAPLFGQGHRPVGPMRFHYFLNYPKLIETCTFEMDALYCSKNSQFLHVARLRYFEQLSKLCRLQIPNRNKVQNPGTDSIFESFMNFKRDSNLLEKSDKFSKIPS
jgi:hypothetical protein